MKKLNDYNTVFEKLVKEMDDKIEKLDRVMKTLDKICFKFDDLVNLHSSLNEWKKNIIDEVRGLSTTYEKINEDLIKVYSLKKNNDKGGDDKR